MIRIICVLLCFISIGFLQAQEVPLKIFKSKLTAQNAKPARNFLDLREGKIFDLIGASYQPEHIDLFVLFGRNTRVNIMLPSSKHITSFGEYLKVNIADGWEVRNKGLLMNVGQGKEVQERFSMVKNLADLISWYTDAEHGIKSNIGYQLRKNGPADNLTRVESGDVILFHSIDRGYYAVGKVIRLEESDEGRLVIEWKVPRSF